MKTESKTIDFRGRQVAVSFTDDCPVFPVHTISPEIHERLERGEKVPAAEVLDGYIDRDFNELDIETGGRLLVDWVSARTCGHRLDPANLVYTY